MEQLTPAQIREAATVLRTGNVQKFASVCAMQRTDGDLSKVLENAGNKALRSRSNSYSFYTAETVGGTTTVATLTLFSGQITGYSGLITSIKFVLSGGLLAATFPIFADASPFRDAKIRITAGNQIRTYPIASCFNVMAAAGSATLGVDQPNGQQTALRGTFEDPLATFIESDNVTIEIIDIEAGATVAAAKGGTVDLGMIECSPS